MNFNKRKGCMYFLNLEYKEINLFYIVYKLYNQKYLFLYFEGVFYFIISNNELSVTNYC